MKRIPLVQIGLVFCAAVLGLVLAELLGKVLQIRAGQAELTEYAARLEQSAILVDEQAEHVMHAVSEDHLPFCSAEEIAQMRSLVYNNMEISDIGRIKDQKLYCASGIGALPRAISMPVPDAVLGDIKIYAWTQIMIAPRTTGFIIQVGGTDVVLNPHTFDGLSDPARSYGVFLFDRGTGKLFQAFGDRMQISKEEILDSRPVERKGIYYRPVCSAKHRACVVAAESQTVTLARTTRLHDVVLLTIASVGDILVLGFILWYRKHGSQARQLRRALRRGALTLVYQPIVNVETGAIVGAEALVRWRNESGQDVGSDIFVALAEEEGFVTEITRHILRSALRELGDLLTSGNFRLTINITSEDLIDSGFFTYLQSTLATANVKSSVFGLEITERSTTNHKAAIERLAVLRNAGFSVYIDDFGTGYSSLAYLRDLAVDGIKIDRAFTATVGTNAITESIIPHILQIAEQLSLSVVAEGIETDAQAEYFRATGKGILGQGWLYSRPVPAAQLRQMARNLET